MKSATNYPYPSGWWRDSGEDPYERWDNCVVSFGFMVDECGCKRRRLRAYLKKKSHIRWGMYYPVVVDDAVKANTKGESRTGYKEPLNGPYGIVFKVYADGPIEPEQAKLNHEVAGVISRPCSHKKKPVGWWKRFGHQFNK